MLTFPVLATTGLRTAGRTAGGAANAEFVDCGGESICLLFFQKIMVYTRGLLDEKRTKGRQFTCCRKILQCWVGCEFMQQMLLDWSMWRSLSTFNLTNYSHALLVQQYVVHTVCTRYTTGTGTYQVYLVYCNLKT